jgi:uncharacterized membrane protein
MGAPGVRMAQGAGLAPVPQPRRWSDERVDLLLSQLLLAGIGISTAVVLLGGVLHFIHHWGERLDLSNFHGERPDLRSVRGVLDGALALRPADVIQLGILLLIATPVARVVLAGIAFALQRDVLYVGICLIVLGLLLFSLIHGGI